ncbi:MAG: hypothetical protein FWD25_02070 [Clostridia bacterium]|nr:hypothetical protein [Clostridia bacterium]
MASIKPIIDFRNSGDGRGKRVILEMEEYERQQVRLDLLAKLVEGEASVQSEADWLSTKALRTKLGI